MEPYWIVGVHVGHGDELHQNLGDASLLLCTFGHATPGIKSFDFPGMLLSLDRPLGWTGGRAGTSFPAAFFKLFLSF